MLGHLIVLASVLDQKPAHLFATTEWMSYQQRLHAAPVYRVSFFSKALGDVQRARWSQLTVRHSREFVLETDKERIFWNGNQAKTFNGRTNSMTVSSKKPALGIFEFFGCAVPLDNTVPTPSGFDLIKLTGEPVWHVDSSAKAMASSEVGWRLVEFGGIDYRRSYEFWFKPESGMLSRATEEAEGAGSTYRCTYDLKWDLQPKLPPDYFTAKPYKPDELLTDNPTLARYSRLVPMKKADPQYGRVVVNFPKGAGGEVAIKLGGQVISSTATDTSFVAELKAGSYLLTIGNNAMSVTVVEGFDRIIKVGAIASVKPTLTAKTDPENSYSFTIRTGKRPDVLLADTYYIKIGATFKKVVVKEGKITRI
jgi:hypothetical protein